MMNAGDEGWKNVTIPLQEVLLDIERLKEAYSSKYSFLYVLKDTEDILLHSCESSAERMSLLKEYESQGTITIQGCEVFSPVRIGLMFDCPFGKEVKFITR